MSHIPLKSKSEIEIIARNAADLAGVLKKVRRETEVGCSLLELDQKAEGLILARGGEAAFKKVPRYRWATCINLNDGVVHGVPGAARLNEGDLISVDLGLWREGWYSDMSRSWVVGKGSGEKEAFVQAGREVLTAAIGQVKPGHRVGHISRSIEEGICQRGYWPVRTLTGHGIGRELHEPPVIPCFQDRDLIRTDELQPGMVLAIEVIYTRQKTNLETAADGWTIRTADGSWGGLEEDMVLVTEEGARILTKLV